MRFNLVNVEYFCKKFIFTEVFKHTDFLLSGSNFILGLILIFGQTSLFLHIHCGP